jgi:hypothetical protein
MVSKKECFGVFRADNYPAECSVNQEDYPTICPIREKYRNGAKNQPKNDLFRDFSGQFFIIRDDFTFDRTAIAAQVDWQP